MVKIGYLIYIADVDDTKVRHLVSDTAEDIILAHAVGIGVAPEADEDDTLFLGEDGLVDVPAASQMVKDNRAHDGGRLGGSWKEGLGLLFILGEMGGWWGRKQGACRAR